jgi:hypothetical protein
MKRIIKIWPMVALIMAALAMTMAFDGCGTPRLASRRGLRAGANERGRHP